MLFHFNNQLSPYISLPQIKFLNRASLFTFQTDKMLVFNQSSSSLTVFIHFILTSLRRPIYFSYTIFMVVFYSRNISSRYDSYIPFIQLSSTVLHFIHLIVTASPFIIFIHDFYCCILLWNLLSLTFHTDLLLPIYFSYTIFWLYFTLISFPAGIIFHLHSIVFLRLTFHTFYLLNFVPFSFHGR